MASKGSEQKFRNYHGNRNMVGEIFGLTPRIATLDGRNFPRPEPPGSDYVFANHVNTGSKSTENRALTPSKPPP